MLNIASVVSAQCDKLVMVVGHKFITLSVQLCVQHDGHNTAHHAGLSVAAETFLLELLSVHDMRENNT